ncbi:MAG: hypothetical protein RL398_1553 [Planctomycetota bacterium]|jgi:hypothetical protein
MMHEVRSIPPAPRRLRVGALLAYRWPLSLSAATLVVSGLLLAWLMFLQAGGKPSDQARLDHEAIETVVGRVLGADEEFVRAGRRWQRTHYTFVAADGEVVGSSFGVPGAHPIGTAVQVEYLRAESNISRVVGDVLHIHVPWCEPRFWLGLLVTPGALLLLGWTAGAFRLRHVAVHGDVSVGRIVAVEAIPLVLPQMLRVTYEFRDHGAVIRRGRHWVRRRGPLGDRLAAAWLLGNRPGARAEALPVLHDRRSPDQNRLLLPLDFVAEARKDLVLPSQFA